MKNRPLHSGQVLHVQRAITWKLTVLPPIAPGAAGEVMRRWRSWPERSWEFTREVRGEGRDS
jgi:hypothetical protein